MTFRGVEYETVLDMQRCLLISNERVKLTQMELKTARLIRDKILIDEIETKLNIQLKWVKQLEESIDEILYKIDLINENLGDLEGQVFQLMFIMGYTDDEITQKLHISNSSLYNAKKKILSKLDGTTGQDILQMLKQN